MDASPCHFVGSLKANQVPELLAIPLTEYQAVPDHPGILAYRTQREVLGQERTVVVTYNEALYLGQLQLELVRLRKLQECLQHMQRQVIQGRRRPTVALAIYIIPSPLYARVPPLPVCSANVTSGALVCQSTQGPTGDRGRFLLFDRHDS